MNLPTRRDDGYAPKSDWGLVRAEIFDPKEIGAGIDIIFVHGLGSNPDTTWLRRNESYDCSPSERVGKIACDSLAGKEMVNWVTDLLHNDLPPYLQNNTRAFFFNYDSFWSRDGIEERLKRIGQDLFERVSDISTPDSGRTFMFVGHSYGGLVIKEAILSAQAYQQHRHVKVFQQTRAIVFMGTPHRGSSEAKIGAMGARVLKLLGLHSVPEILEAITYDSHGLRDMHRHFEAVSQNLTMVNFYETVKLLKFGGLYRVYAASEASATLDRPNVQNLGLHTDHIGLNKYWRRDSDYKRVSGKLISLMETICKKGRGARSVYVIPPDLAKEYTERDELYSNLRESLREPGNIVAAVGLGGMGKTQLALRYAQGHKDRYDTILWIDARSTTAILSSFQYCARKLSEFSESASHSEGLKDPSAVDIVLRWLDQRGKEYSESLLILDHLDDLSVGVGTYIPTDLHGSIIVTSRNTLCLNVLPNNSQQLDVGDMTASEAVSLFIRHLNLSITEIPGDILNLSRQICSGMHWSALAVHLAGAQLWMDFAGSQHKNLSEIKIKLEKLLRDTKYHKEEIFMAETVSGMSTYNLTTYTVLDSSLEAISAKFPNLSSRRLLVFLAHFEATDIPDSLFGYVARAIAEGKDDVARKLPSWLRYLLRVYEDGNFDDFNLRDALKPLQQYGLVSYSQSHECTHISMHDLVRWKAMKDGKETRQDELPWDAVQAMFHASAVRQVWVEDYIDPGTFETLEFISRYAPGPDVFLSAPIDRTDSVLDMIGNLYEQDSRKNNKDALELWEALVAGSELDAFGSEYSCNILARRLNLMSLKFVRTWPSSQKAAKDFTTECTVNQVLSYRALDEVAWYCSRTHQYDKAEKALQVRIDQALRMFHPQDTAHLFARWDILEFYMTQERWDDAKAMQKILAESTEWVIFKGWQYRHLTFRFEHLELPFQSNHLTGARLPISRTSKRGLPPPDNTPTT